MKHCGVLALLVVAAAMLCDAKVVVPMTRDDASDAYIDQVNIFLFSYTCFIRIL